MRILVTGHLGFIGRYLTRELRRAGHDVSGLDWADGLHGHLDLRKRGTAHLAVQRAEPDVVVHLAGFVGRLMCEESPQEALPQNVLTTLHVADAAAAVGATLVHCSTSEVYGDHGNKVCSEDEPFARSSGVYALVNRWAEEAARDYGPDDTRIIRPTMPYGPGSPPGHGRRALDNMLWHAEHRRPIVVHGGARRSWCWAADVAAGFRCVIEDGLPGAYNVGRDDDERSMLDIARIACDLTGAPRDLIEVVPGPPRQTLVKRLSTGKLRALGWAPTVDLEDGMRLTYQWIRQFDAAGRLRLETAA